MALTSPSPSRTAAPSFAAAFHASQLNLLSPIAPPAPPPATTTAAAAATPSPAMSPAFNPPPLMLRQSLLPPSMRRDPTDHPWEGVEIDPATLLPHPNPTTPATPATAVGSGAGPAAHPLARTASAVSSASTILSDSPLDLQHLASAQTNGFAAPGFQPTQPSDDEETGSEGGQTVPNSDYDTSSDSEAMLLDLDGFPFGSFPTFADTIHATKAASTAGPASLRQYPPHQQAQWAPTLRHPQHPANIGAGLNTSSKTPSPPPQALADFRLLAQMASVLHQDGSPEQALEALRLMKLQLQLQQQQQQSGPGSNININHSNAATAGAAASTPSPARQAKAAAKGDLPLHERPRVVSSLRSVLNKRRTKKHEWDEAILGLSTTELNAFLKTAGLTSAEEANLKAERRRLKNRLYARASRARKRSRAAKLLAQQG